MPSLADQLAKLADPEPVDFDPEDDYSSGPETEKPTATEHYVEVGKSTIRDDDISLDGPKYQGSRITRSNLYDDDEDEEEDDEEEEVADQEDEDEGEEDEEEDEEDEEELQSGVEGLIDSNSEDYDEEDDEDDEEADEDDEEDDDQAEESNISEEAAKREQLKKILAAEQKSLISRLSSSAQSDVLKGAAVNEQMNIYESIVDARIKVQKALQASNELPLTSDDAIEYSTVDTADALKSTTHRCLKLLRQIAETRLKLMNSDKVFLGDNSVTLSKKRKLEKASTDASELDTHLHSYRDSVLTKWSQKVQSSSGSLALQSSKFKSLNQTAAIQVTTVLADMERLVKRTKLNRTEVKILGSEQQPVDDAPDRVDSGLQEDANVFDDTDFYRQILKELVDKRMADSAATGGLKWSVAKSKMKKTVDTKASKGRKLRYHVQEQVQGFDAPHPSVTWTDEQIDDLFASLLGQKIKMDETVPSDEEAEEDIVATDGLRIFG